IPFFKIHPDDQPIVRRCFLFYFRRHFSKFGRIFQFQCNNGLICCWIEILFGTSLFDIRSVKQFVVVDIAEGRACRCPNHLPCFCVLHDCSHCRRFPHFLIRYGPRRLIDRLPCLLPPSTTFHTPLRTIWSAPPQAKSAPHRFPPPAPPVSYDPRGGRSVCSY